MWVVIVLLLGQPPEIVSGDYPTKPVCDHWRRVHEASHPQWRKHLRCTLRRPGMIDHEIHYTGEDD